MIFLVFGTKPLGAKVLEIFGAGENEKKIPAVCVKRLLEFQTNEAVEYCV